ncbi:Crp/Fnr family transcriptional regulator [Paenibacillus ihuae]|uniref:Crp/Fnr family transcriptional regulator n=1 Tax=Paenibacillus ihuae TaxID=1232431 RepID=UPI0006D5513C|nr:Crp/Fnr family transcriptional regulator [Paenibacillus ihuae]
MKQLLQQYMSRLTSLSEAEQHAILDEILVETYSKGTVLLRQGEVPGKCYFVLKGCVRQHAVDVTGREVTSNFYTEEQAISIFNAHKPDKSSDYTLTCLENSVLVVGPLDTEREMYAKHTQLEMMTRRMIEESFGQVQEEFATFIASTPEERLKALLHQRPGLISRVPQHQLASYLGMTPESLSRIKKRIYREHAELEL